MPRSLQLRLLDIHRAAEKIKQMIETREAFLSNVVVQDAVAYNVMAIGEACSHLPETLKQEIPEIPWNAIRGLRNLLTHEYFIIVFHANYIHICKCMIPFFSQNGPMPSYT